MNFIKDSATGQEIPDPPKFIDFCRGDISDTISEASMDEAYTVAQFPRPINPTIRSSSPQPSMFESHHDPRPNATLAQDMGLGYKPAQAPVPEQDPFRRSDRSDRSVRAPLQQQPLPDARGSARGHPSRGHPYQQESFAMSGAEIPQIPHEPFPQDGMTQFCRTKPIMAPPSERSAAPSPNRPVSRDSNSDYSNVSSFTSYGPSSGNVSPVKQMNAPPIQHSHQPTVEDEPSPKKRGFFNSPFRRKSKRELNSEHSSATVTPTNNRNTWSAPPTGRTNSYDVDSPSRSRGRGGAFGRGQDGTPEPEPVDPRANFQLNVGNNVFDVASPDARNKPMPAQPINPDMDMDPIAQALEDLKGITKASSVRQTADRYAGLRTPAPQASPLPGGMPTPLSNANIAGAKRGTPPPAYDRPVGHLGAPPAAHTSRAMQEATKKFTSQKDQMFNNSAPNYSRNQSQSGGNGGTWNRRQGADVMRATSPGPPRATSPRPDMYSQQSPQHGRPPSNAGYNRPTSSTGYNQPPASAGYDNRAPSPNPYGSAGAGSGGRPRANTNYGSQRGNSMPRAVSPQPQFAASASRPGSRTGAGPVQLASPSPHQEGYGTSRGRPQSQYYGNTNTAPSNEVGRVRSKSVAEPRQTTRDGKAIMHYGKPTSPLSLLR